MHGVSVTSLLYFSPTGSWETWLSFWNAISNRYMYKNLPTIHVGLTLGISLVAPSYYFNQLWPDLKAMQRHYATKWTRWSKMISFAPDCFNLCSDIVSYHNFIIYMNYSTASSIHSVRVLIRCIFQTSIDKISQLDMVLVISTPPRV